MKLHIGVDAETGVVHSVATTPANVHDVTEVPRLLYGGEEQVWGDAGYQGVHKRDENRGLEVEWQVAMRPGKRRKLEPGSEAAAAEKRKASVRAKVEHPFLYVKRRFRYAKVRNRGLVKNTQRLMTLLGFAKSDEGRVSLGGVTWYKCARNQCRAGESVPDAPSTCPLTAERLPGSVQSTSLQLEVDCLEIP